MMDRPTAAKLALAAHASARPGERPLSVVGDAWQLAASLIALCEREGVVFEDIVSDARDFTEAERLTSGIVLNGPRAIVMRQPGPPARRRIEPRRIAERVRTLLLS